MMTLVKPRGGEQGIAPESAPKGMRAPEGRGLRQGAATATPETFTCCASASFKNRN